MRSRSIDRGLVLLGIVLMLVSSYQLFFRHEFSSESRVLGTLVSTLSVVKIKNAMNLDWKDAYMGNEVSENQLIYTDQDASASVKFIHGDQLEIGSNSLIKVSSKGQDASLSVERGMIKAKIEGDEPLLININGEELLLTGKGSEVQINMDNKKGEIGVLKGAVVVENEGKKNSLDSSTSLSVDGGVLTPKAIHFQIIEPKHDAVFYSNSETSPVSFKWMPEEECKILVSRSPHMDNSIDSGKEFRPGTYYYRVENEKGTSLIHSFKIIQERAPVLLRPLSGNTVTMLQKGNEGAPVVLQWKGEKNLKYKVEWTLKEQNNEAVLDRSSLRLLFTETETLRWRLKIEDAKRPLAVWSDWQEVKLVIAPLPEVPSDLRPNGVEFQTYQGPSEEVEISWISKFPVEWELIRPSGAKENKKIIDKKITIKTDQAGIYKFRARSYDAYDRLSEWSEFSSFEIVDLTSENDDAVQRIQLKRPDQLVNFEWETSSGTTAHFELARDASFKEVILKKDVNSTGTSVTIPEIGSYYWRSREILSDGTINVRRPVKVIIEKAPSPSRPDKLPDMQVPLEWRPKGKKTSWNILDFLIPSAHADDELVGIAKIELPADENAKAYSIKIFLDESLTNLVLEKNIKGRHFEWEGAVPGVYYWQYAVIDYWDRPSPFSEPAVLTVLKKNIAPGKSILLHPLKAIVLRPNELKFQWMSAEGARSYKVQISKNMTFDPILFESLVKANSLSITDLKSGPGLYYWRVITRSADGIETSSNLGSFNLRRKLERIIISDQHASVWKKRWINRLAIAWTPSMDSYTFTQSGQTGTISGQSILGLKLQGTHFTNDWIFNGEFIRQSGKVFKNQDYLFQRILLGLTRSLNIGEKHNFSLGFEFGQTSGLAYSITSAEVKGQGISSFSFGPVMRSYVAFNKLWELHSKASYLLGAIKQMEVEGNIIRNWNNKFLVFGLVYGKRDYQVNTGQQSSIKFLIGVGKEF